MGTYPCELYNTDPALMCENMLLEEEKPALDIMIEWGDGTPPGVWTRQDPRYIHAHRYSLPGIYGTSVYGELSVSLLISI